MAESISKKLAPSRLDELMGVIGSRFEQNMNRHEGVEWNKIAFRLKKAEPAKLRTLFEMERTGGEPDVVGMDEDTGEFLFFDCAAESPKGRRSVCYDPEALESRKKFKPEHSALELAKEMGAELLTEEEYRKLQELGEFDTKTSSWLKTPSKVRKLGGAIFGDRRYNRVFIYHNGAESYYAARGFRVKLKI